MAHVDWACGMVSRQTKRGWPNRTPVLRGLTAVVCLLGLIFLIVAAAIVSSSGHAGPGLLWANLVGIFIFFATVVIVSLLRSAETLLLPACEWAASVSPRAPPSI